MSDKWQLTISIPQSNSDSGSDNDVNSALFQDAVSKVKEDNYGHASDPVEIYLRDIRSAKLLTKEEEVHYARLVQKGCQEARRVMIVSNLRLVVKIARRYIRSAVSLLDLIEEGNIGLMHAVEKFDPERGFRFSTYGAWWIQQTIERAIMNQSRTVRLPVHVVKKLNACLRAKRKLSAEASGDPTARELAVVLNQSVDEVEQILALNEKSLSIDHPVSNDVNKPFVDTLRAMSSDDPESHISESFLKDKLVEWVQILTPKQRAVIIRRFGLMGYEPTTLDQTGLDIGLTRERVRQIQSEALKRLRTLIEGFGNDKETLLAS